jgi:hypothetical protein
MEQCVDIPARNFPAVIPVIAIVISGVSVKLDIGIIGNHHPVSWRKFGTGSPAGVESVYVMPLSGPYRRIGFPGYDPGATSGRYFIKDYTHLRGIADKILFSGVFHKCGDLYQTIMCVILSDQIQVDSCGQIRTICLVNEGAGILDGGFDPGVNPGVYRILNLCETA